jgi:uncharacterized protein YdeI (YjbR/CyaY-like superfamily)
VKLATSQKVEIPAELIKELDTNSELKKAFNLITSGKQKEYSLYIIEAKRELTKQNRIEKIVPMILKGIGLNDKYKNF